MTIDHSLQPIRNTPLTRSRRSILRLLVLAAAAAGACTAQAPAPGANPPPSTPVQPAPAPAAEPASSAQAFVGHVWRDTNPAAASGTLRAFLPDGTLILTSCVETYRLARWMPAGDQRIRWQEDTAV